VDTDEAIRIRAGKTIQAIFEDEGEAGFRKREAEAVARAAQETEAVVAVGGGAVEDPDNVRRLERTGVLVFLTARPVVLYKRVVSDSRSGASRPALTGLDPFQEMETVVRKRADAYASAARATVDTEGKTEAEVAAEVEKTFRRLAAEGQDG